MASLEEQFQRLIDSAQVKTNTEFQPSTHVNAQPPPIHPNLNPNLNPNFNPNPMHFVKFQFQGLYYH